MTKEKFSWLAAVLCCLYFIYSQVILNISMMEHDNISVLCLIYILVSLLIAVLIAKKTIIGIILSILFPVAVIVFMIIDKFSIEWSLILCVLIFPSIIIGSHMFKYQLNEDNKKVDSEKSGRNNNLLKTILFLIYSLVIFFYMMLSTNFFNDYFNIFGLSRSSYIEIYKIIIFLLIFYYTVSVIKKNETARKISISFPFVLFYAITLNLTLYGMKTGFFYDNGLMFGPPFWMYYVADIIIFITLWLLSLPYYYKKIKVME
jgi:hypothetical protein